MKSIKNLNTLNALIRDEDMAHKEYKLLAQSPGIPQAISEELIRMSNDELRHRNNIMRFKKIFATLKKNDKMLGRK